MKSNPHAKKVLLGLSGGVDSAVAALLLIEAGHQVVGLFMKNWEGDEESCTAKEDYEDVARICDTLGIDHYSYSFAREYWDEVFTSFLDTLHKGWTPNPDILCNRHIKFAHFRTLAKKLDFEWMATGHYARVRTNTLGQPELLQAIDPTKDQTYFLTGLSHQQLGGVMFPVGEIPKTKVRELARNAQLPVHAKKDSTGICFIGEQKFAPFVAKYLRTKPGAFVTPDGKIVGRHKGAALYTLGQRRGLGLGGQGEAWFVVSKNMEENTVTVVRGGDDPLLFSGVCEARELSFVAGVPPTKSRLAARVRYRQALEPCTVEFDGDRLRAVFDRPQRAVTPGQWIVLYDGEICLGGGVIYSKA